MRAASQPRSARGAGPVILQDRSVLQGELGKGPDFSKIPRDDYSCFLRGGKGADPPFPGSQGQAWEIPAGDSSSPSVQSSFL